MHFCIKVLLFIFITHSLQAQNLQDIQTFEANFTQTIRSPSGKKISYRGILHIHEPSLVRWQYITPIEKFVYIKKYTITIIEPDLEQVVVTKLDKEINVLELLKQATLISQNTYSSNFNNIQYILTLKNNLLENIQYKDELENEVIITFKKVHQNHKIDNSIFKFTIPHDYDVIKK